MAENNLGKVLLDLRSSALLPEAIRQSFRGGAAPQARFRAGGHVNLGSALDETGRPQQAIGEYEVALRLEPRLVEAHYDLGAALGQIPGRRNESIAEYREAIRFEPDDVAAHNNLGNALVAAGGTGEGIGEYEQALRLDPAFADGQNNLGFALALAEEAAGRPSRIIGKPCASGRTLPPPITIWAPPSGSSPGRLDDAIAEYRETLRLDPNEAAAHNNLGSALVAAGRIREAIGQFEGRAAPGSRHGPDAHHNLGSAFDAAGRTEEAIGQYEAALRLRPWMLAETRYNLGIALQETPGRLGGGGRRISGSPPGSSPTTSPKRTITSASRWAPRGARMRPSPSIRSRAAPGSRPRRGAFGNLGAAFASQARYEEAAAQSSRGGSLALQPDNVAARRALAAIKASQP